MAHNFFNFNLDGIEAINTQIDVLEAKFRKHRNNPDSLMAERKVRAYVVEAIVAFSNPSVTGARTYVESHPASEVLTQMLNWLKDRGYKTTIRTSEGVIITSPRNTYVAAPFNDVDNVLPKSVNVMSMIMSPRNRVLMND